MWLYARLFRTSIFLQCSNCSDMASHGHHILLGPSSHKLQEPGWAVRLSDLSCLWSRPPLKLLTDISVFVWLIIWIYQQPGSDTNIFPSSMSIYIAVPTYWKFSAACQLKDVFYWNLNVGYRLPFGWSSGFGESVTNTACNLRTPALCSRSHLFRLIDTNFENLFACKLKDMLCS